MASRVYDELYAEYGRTPTEGEVCLRLERKLGRDRVTISAEDATSRTAAAAGGPERSSSGSSLFYRGPLERLELRIHQLAV